LTDNEENFAPQVNKNVKENSKDHLRFIQSRIKTMETLAFLLLLFVGYSMEDESICAVCDPNIDAMHQPELSRIWNNIVNQEKILHVASIGIKEDVVREEPLPLILNSTTKSHVSDGLVYASESRGPRHHSGGSNVEMMTRIFHEYFIHKRSDDFDPELKKRSRQGIIDKLAHYTLETVSICTWNFERI